MQANAKIVKTLAVLVVLNLALFLGQVGTAGATTTYKGWCESCYNPDGSTFACCVIGCADSPVCCAKTSDCPR